MSQHIIVADHDPLWKEKYKEESVRIRKILANNCLAIYHIGSTAVKGLAAKPVIDILVVVKDLEMTDEAAIDFLKIGYEYLGEFGIAGRRYLRKGGDERTHQIHIFQADDWNNIGRHLAFCDYMRTHEKERNEYAEIKKELARKFPYDIDRYCEGKETFVRHIEELAVSQFDGDWDKMYIAARNVQWERKVSLWIEAGAVSAAILTPKGNIYVGVCLDTACSLGMCAERNAIANMITNGESTICRVMVIDRNDRSILPCGACRELMTQLMPDHYRDIEIMLDHEHKEVVKLGDLTSHWWI